MKLIFSNQRALAFLVGLCLLRLGTGQVAGADRVPDGRRIYRQLCIKCHGPAGEGVKGKHEEPLSGDSSAEKLSSYIAKNMPDDDPGKCVGDDAAAVARYIYDSFYSREARARHHPARVELLHLTNRQYVNAVADLIKHFTEPDALTITNSEPGLRALYYKSHETRKENQIIDRIDRRIDFDFGSGNPAPDQITTNGFAMQWRGSLVADESGEYEIVLRTPNGARLWLNDQTDPLIDAWVASGTLQEVKAVTRLIGGRVYPLRLDYFKFKDKTAAISLSWKPPRGALEPIPARSLTPARSTPTFVVTTPFPPDDSSVGYERGVAVSKAWDEAATHAALEVANYVANHLDALAGTRLNNTNRAAKVETFCGEFVATAFRRPLTKDQVRLFVSNHFKKGIKLEDAVKRVVILALKSPRFLYLNLDGEMPDDYTIASRLSFAIWDSIPDRALLKTAAAAELRTPEQVRARAVAMLSDPRAHAKMQEFLQHWLQMNRAEDLSKDSRLYPGFTPEIIADLRTSLNLFLEEVVWSGSSDYRDLLLADYVFLNNRLAKYYGVETNAVDDFVKVKLDASHRSGVLTHPYLLAAFSYQKSSSPIHRGVFLTRNIVGRALKPPPMAMTFKDEDFAPNLTMREKVSQLTRAQSCQGCHSVINPLGFSLEQYDAVGRFRTRENDRDIEVESDYATDSGETVRLKGARDVAEFALKSDQARGAFIEQFFHQVVKQPILAYGADVGNDLQRSFSKSEFNLQKLFVDMAALSALKDVRNPANPNRKPDERRRVISAR